MTSRSACLVPAAGVAGRAVRTVEASPTASSARLPPSMALHGGICTPGMLVANAALLEHDAAVGKRRATRFEACAATSYRKIIDAVIMHPGIGVTPAARQQPSDRRSPVGSTTSQGGGPTVLGPTTYLPCALRAGRPLNHRIVYSAISCFVDIRIIAVLPRRIFRTAASHHHRLRQPAAEGVRFAARLCRDRRRARGRAGHCVRFRLVTARRIAHRGVAQAQC